MNIYIGKYPDTWEYYDVRQALCHSSYDEISSIVDIELTNNEDFSYEYTDKDLII